MSALTKWPVPLGDRPPRAMPALVSGEGAHEPRGVTVDLHLGDCLEYMRTMPNKSVDCVVTDPPYGLKFMGKGWDHGVPGVPFWEAALRVAKPGAMLLAFGGTRTHHRLMCAIEDAGWEIRDCLMWLYGSGFPKGHSQLKPAWEPIVMARKPLIGTVAANVQAWGCGGLNVDACRIKANGDALVRPAITRNDNNAYGKGLGVGVQVEPQGRWPANLILDEEAAAMLDEQTGMLTSGGGIKGNLLGQDSARDVYAGGFKRGAKQDGLIGDTGGASRFFYVAKASKRDRDEGLEGMPLRKAETMNSYVHPSEGRTADKNGGPKANHHPTVKPTQLMRYLCRMVTPSGGVVLDPFCGSGSTGKAAVMEGFSFIGIDTEAEYLAIATKRIEEAQLQLPLLEAT